MEIPKRQASKQKECVDFFLQKAHSKAKKILKKYRIKAWLY
jgi:hypothetical protein